MFEINKLHPFVDANKRTAFLATYIFLSLNGYELKVEKEEVVKLSIDTSICSTDLPKISNWIKNNLHKIRRY